MKRLTLAAALAASVIAGSAAAETYQIEPNHTQVHFSYSHGGWSNISVRFDQVAGIITYDPADVAASTVEVAIPVRSVSSGVDDFNAHMLSPDLFDAAKHPNASFKSTAVAAAGEGKLRVTGDLTIHGVTKSTTFDVTVNKVGEQRGRPHIGFDAVGVIQRADFGVDRFLPNAADVKITVTVEAQGPEVEAAAGG